MPDPVSDTIPLETAQQAVAAMSRRVALLHMCYARVLLDELGKERGKALVGQAIRAYGTLIGQETRRRVQAQGLEPLPEHFDRGSDLPPVGFTNQPVEIEGEPRTRFFGCILAEVWSQYGEQALGGLYCEVDPAKMEGYAGEWTMVHTQKVTDGAECCEMAVRRKTQPAAE